MVSMKVFCVRIGDKYGPEYEDYINDKLHWCDVHWIRAPFHPHVPLQWNKLQVFNMDIDEPVVVMDIDKLLINDYEEILHYTCNKGEFVSVPFWWDFEAYKFKTSGGFYKFWPKECKNIYEKYMSDIPYWTNYYIKNGFTNGPVNGEFMFVQENIDVELKLMPDSWFTRWHSTNSTQKIEDKYQELTGNKLFNNHVWHSDIKMVHFTSSQNKPHEWIHYDKYIQSR
tara:strand:- start:3686 stop:4363 length:678 start_codon:yes stop_codon:yes gene_type:complete